MVRPDLSRKDSRTSAGRVKSPTMTHITLTGSPMKPHDPTHADTASHCPTHNPTARDRAAGNSARPGIAFALMLGAAVLIAPSGCARQTSHVESHSTTRDDPACANSTAAGSADASRASESSSTSASPAEALRLVTVDAPASHAGQLGADEAFAFAAQGYGPDGSTRAGVLVQDRRTGLWFEIVRAPTAGGTFGRSPREATRVSVAWDYARYAAQPSVDFPLMTSGSVNLPQRVVFEADAYRLRFNERNMPAESLTEILIPKADLRRAIEAAQSGWLEEPRRTLIGSANFL